METKTVDFEALERAQRLNKRIRGLRELGDEDTNQLLLRQAALIFRLQQDVFVKFGANFAEPASRLQSEEDVARDLHAGEAVENLGLSLHKMWRRHIAGRNRRESLFLV